MSMPLFVPSLITAALATACVPLQLTVLASGRSTPVGHIVRYDAPVPLTTVTLIETAVDSSGTWSFTEMETICVAFKVLIGLAASRVSSTRTGTTETRADDCPEE